jgi:hypothetical protein
MAAKVHVRRLPKHHPSNCGTGKEEVKKSEDAPATKGSHHSDQWPHLALVWKVRIFWQRGEPAVTIRRIKAVQAGSEGRETLGLVRTYASHRSRLRLTDDTAGYNRGDYVPLEEGSYSFIGIFWLSPEYEVELRVERDAAGVEYGKEGRKSV